MRAKAGVPAPPPAKNTPAPITTSNFKNTPGLNQEDLQRRIAEVKARVAGASQAVSIYFHGAIIVSTRTYVFTLYLSRILQQEVVCPSNDQEVD
jgi:hypothetical protein